MLFRGFQMPTANHSASGAMSVSIETVGEGLDEWLLSCWESLSLSCKAFSSNGLKRFVFLGFQLKRSIRRPLELV